MARSAGLLMYRRTSALQVLLVHPGGPFFARKDAGVWGLPKGLVEPGEDELEAALREFCEETSLPRPRTTFQSIGEVVLKGGKVVVAWAFEGDCDAAAVSSNEFELEWPPRSGRVRSFPEIDRAEWFAIDAARSKVNPAQAPFLDRLELL